MSRLIPRGAVVAGLGKRFLASVIDALPLVLIYGLVFAALMLDRSPTTMLVASIVGVVPAAGYGLYQWWAYASRGAGLGARIRGLRLVGMTDGEPIGWWRFFLRQLVFAALMGTVIGGIALLVFLVIHERRQGWHDMVGGAVVVQPKQTEAKVSSTPKKVPTASTVGLPPHLSSTFSPQPGTSSSSGFAPDSPAPEWLPGVQAEPIGQQAPFGQQPSYGSPQQQWSAPEAQWSAPEPQWGQPAVPQQAPAPQPPGVPVQPAAPSQPAWQPTRLPKRLRFRPSRSSLAGPQQSWSPPAHPEPAQPMSPTPASPAELDPAAHAVVCDRAWGSGAQEGVRRGRG